MLALSFFCAEQIVTDTHKALRLSSKVELVRRGATRYESIFGDRFILL